MALAAPTLTATVDAANGGVDLVVGSIPAGATRLTVSRTHPSGRVWNVRLMNAAPVIGTTAFGTDFEAPLGVAVTYRATVASATETSPASAPVTVTLETSTSDTNWLKDPRQPPLNRRVMVERLDTQENQGRVGIMEVIGRPAPVSIGDTREAATGTLRLVTLTADEMIGIHQLTASGNPLLFQTSARYGVGNLYLVVSKVTERRISRLGRLAERAFDLDWIEVDPPAGLPAGGSASYAQARDVYATYAALRAGEADYLDLAQHVAGAGHRAMSDLLTWRGG